MMTQGRSERVCWIPKENRQRGEFEVGGVVGCVGAVW